MVYFEKSQPSPDCLDIEKAKSSGDYKCGDVLTRIKDDFKNKCYICEYKEPITINIEHFRPHKGNLNLKFKWENLFWSCGHCNNIKLDNFEDIIDCTDIDENIENRIKLSMKPYPKEKVIVEALDTNSSTLSTVKLLEDVFNGTTKLKTIEASNLRNKVLEDIKDFQKHLINYYTDGFDTDDKNYFLAEIKRHLKKSSNFTSFKRNIIRDNDEMRTDLEKYFD
ncbi:hypothetical protein [Chryseobacterium sp. BIGb0232]|uniref:hypothetical protein n=1 Tax=Chryseobacterium sp. BIGb0232 TaxID=2940598 RepID=UPI000F9E83E0|nr:hypothetical protein [Chryseobacterium sp. BIGb0232]MCS4304887.1 uncharacterized protein (TIGR02646 family) [Chryseobacterium sp. BIGb0232]ROS09693.1 uncharacterized protein (TIGR02646 family) [Chryseobacterium nakagawai]